nr:hypothetical protein [Tanacetum cinerariifolium]
MKWGAQYVHGTSDDFKTHIKDVNAFIGESDAQMLINKIGNRKKFVPNFTFQYKVVNSELVAMFWADEVAKCNYNEFEDIISFDATFRTNKTLNTSTEKEVVQQKEYVTEYKVQVPKPPSQKTGDVIKDIYVVEKPQQNDVNNPQRARNKGGWRRERRKSEREIVLKAKTKQIQRCLCYGEKTNKHTKSTCPSNPKYVAKLARLVVVVVVAEQGTTIAAATEQATTTTTTAE